MTRAVPAPATGWRVGGRVYLRKHDAYYAIAKALTVVKYPGWLRHGEPTELHSYAPAWSDELRLTRLDKAAALFNSHVYTDDPGGTFCEKRWRKFLRRVARFLAFVDSKRIDPDVGPASDLIELFTQAENALAWWGERASRIERRRAQLAVFPNA